MNEPLPLKVTASELLKSQFRKFTSVTNKLEAMFNFRTLVAGWYGDETIEFELHFEFVCQVEFGLFVEQNTKAQASFIADDVFTMHDSADTKVKVIISITPKESDLLQEHPKLLAQVIEKKLYKTINILAQKLSLPLIE